MAISLTADGIVYSSGLTQTKTNPIIKHRLTSGTTVVQAMSVVSPVFINGCEISMGVPRNSLNWYFFKYSLNMKRSLFMCRYNIFFINYHNNLKSI